MKSLKITAISVVSIVVALFIAVPAAFAATTLGTAITLPSQPFAVIFSPDGTKAYAATNAGVSVIDVATGAVTQVSGISGGFAGLAILPNGSTLYASRSSSNEVFIIDTASASVSSTILSTNDAPSTMAVSVDGQKLYVVDEDNYVNVFDTALVDPASVIIHTGSPDAIGIATNPAGGIAYITALNGADLTIAGTVEVLDVASGLITGSITVGLEPEGVAFNPAGTLAFVANRGSDSVTVIDVTSGSVRSSISVGDQPNALAVSPDGSTLYVTNKGDATISIIDIAAGSVTGVINMSPGTRPTSVAFQPSGSLAYVANLGTYDFNNSGFEPGTFNVQPILIDPPLYPTTSPTPTPTPELAATGTQAQPQYLLAFALLLAGLVGLGYSVRRKAVSN